MIEEMTQKLRGDNVKIIWMPKKHYELDPSQYISVFFLSLICSNIQKYPGIKDLKELCRYTLDYSFPNDMWDNAVEWAEKCERKYLNIDTGSDGDDENSDEAEEQDDETSNGTTSEAENQVNHVSETSNGTSVEAENQVEPDEQNGETSNGTSA